MGGGRWDDDAYKARSTAKATAGYSTAFTHDEDIRRGRKRAGVDDRLNPKSVNANGEHADKNIREAMDSDEHPNATPIMVFFDVTGSMGSIPQVLQAKLQELHGILQRKGYVEDPQICFGAIGDAYSDQAPLQVGQFESDVRMDDDLSAIWLEGMGGGYNHESYELGMFFALFHTHLDIQKKRGDKGYLFLIGDERPYAAVDAERVRQVIGGVSAEYADTMTTKDLVERLKEKFHVFFLFAEQGSYTIDQTIGGTYENYAGLSGGQKEGIGWRELLGESAIPLSNAEEVCASIALALGVTEGTVTLEDGMEDLKEVGFDAGAVAGAGKALAMVGAGSGPVATTSGELPGLDEDDDSGTERL